MFNKDCLERIGRAFITGAIAAGAGLHIFAGDGTSFDITNLEQAWKPLVIGGILSVVTLLKAQWGLGRGDDPESGSWKGISGTS